jgi:AcrR family transcriptional regulator
MARDIDNLTGRNLVLEVACDLFMEKGYDGVSMQQIADAAHMTKGSPYYHFKGKEDLFAHAFTRRVGQIHEGLEAILDQAGPLRERLIAGFTYLLATTDSGLFRLIDDFQRVIGPERAKDYLEKLIKPDEMLETYRTVFASAVDGGPALRLPPDRAAAALNALQMGTLHMSHHRHDAASMSPARARELATETIDLFLYGALAGDDSPVRS